jgi:hypothetical protein
MKLLTRAALQLKRAQQWTPGRGAAISLLVASPLLGACLGAILRRPPTYPEQAQALVVLANSSSALGGTRTEQVRTLATALSAPPVSTAIKLGAGASRTGVPLSGSLSVESQPAAGTLTVIADADNGLAAAALANSSSSYAVTLAGRVQAAANVPYSIPASDFNDGGGAWDGISQFALRPTGLAVTPTGGRFSGGSLKVTCSGKPGCGPATSLDFVVMPHHTYTGVVWARAQSRPFLAVAFLGGDIRDATTGPQVTLTRTWHKLLVSWRPLRSHSSIELGMLTSSHRSTRFVIDAASLTDGPLPPSPAQEQRLSADSGAALASPARVTGAVPADTTLSAALGAVAGLLAAVAGCAAGAIARRRQSATQQ